MRTGIADRAAGALLGMAAGDALGAGYEFGPALSAATEVEMIGACQMCPYMKRISLPKILACLQNESPEVTVPAEIIPRARRAVERMLELS